MDATPQPSDGNAPWALAPVPVLLAEAARLDPRCRAFGAHRHRYALALPCREGDLAGIERRAGAPLPPDYRRFLLELGNGGAGPAYGLLPPGSVPNGPPIFERWEAEVDLGAPFPQTPPGLGECPDDAPEEELAAYDSSAQINGSLPVADYGCGMVARLVVTGPQRGRVWIDARSESQGLAPLDAFAARDLHGTPRYTGTPSPEPWLDKDEAMPFAGWYLDWLTRLLAQLRAGGEG